VSWKHGTRLSLALTDVFICHKVWQDTLSIQLAMDLVSVERGVVLSFI